MVPTLHGLALAVCVSHASRIVDVGDTPYHIVRPILRKLNAKQLRTVEENSPTIMPELDELWAWLVEKDFPDRPFLTNSKSSLVFECNDGMPNKAMYDRYGAEQEKFRDHSAQKLRRMTQKIQQQKSKNSITSISGILREPLIRRRQFSTRTTHTPRYNRKSILGKAKNDLRHRPLMFKAGGMRPLTDPFVMFRPDKPAVRPRPPTVNPNSQGIYLLSKSGSQSSSEVTSGRGTGPPTITGLATNSSRPQATGSAPEISRSSLPGSKRLAPTSSIFIPKKRKVVKSEVKKEVKLREQRDEPSSENAQASPRRIKLSLFS